MKKTMIFLFAGLIINTAAFAVGPDKQVDCKEIADKVKQAKAAAAQAATQQPAAAAGAKVNDAQ